MAGQQVLEYLLADLFFDEETSFFEERWKSVTEKAGDVRKYQIHYFDKKEKAVD